MVEIKLHKGNETYVLRYRVGDEARVIDAMIELAQDKHCNFDWYDAAIITYELGSKEYKFKVENSGLR